MPYGKIAGLLRDRFGLTITRGGVVQAIHRAARQAQPTYAQLCETVRGSPVVTVDETSWRVDADLQWLWAYVTPETTVYAIQAGRGLAQAAQVIGLDYPGVLQRDGWQSYRCFRAALHQTCLAHLLRRCRVLLLDYPEHPFVRTVKAVLQAALATRDAYRRGDVSAHGLAIARGHYLARLDDCWNARPVGAPQSAGFNSTSSSNSPLSSVSSSTRRLMPPIGAPNTPCVRPSSPARCAAAASNQPRRGQSADPHQRAAHRRSARTQRHGSVGHAPDRTHPDGAPKSAHSPCDTLTR